MVIDRCEESLFLEIGDKLRDLRVLLLIFFILNLLSLGSLLVCIGGIGVLLRELIGLCVLLVTRVLFEL